eukprot:scaffold46385_cov19-Tisochrysis_lutea.AAC.5
MEQRDMHASEQRVIGARSVAAEGQAHGGRKHEAQSTLQAKQAHNKAAFRHSHKGLNHNPMERVPAYLRQLLLLSRCLGLCLCYKRARWLAAGLALGGTGDAGKIKTKEWGVLACTRKHGRCRALLAATLSEVHLQAWPVHTTQTTDKTKWKCGVFASMGSAEDRGNRV